MARKGSKYARKRAVDTPVQRHSPLPESDSAVLDVIYDDVSYLETFDKLDSDEQVRVYLVLKELAETSPQHVSKTERALIKESAYKLDKINTWAGLKQEEMLRRPLSQDEHHVLRMDCYGSIDHRPAHKLSAFYKSLRNVRVDRPLPPSGYNLADPDAAPAWQIFRQFRNFRKIEPRLQSYLSEQRADPRLLAVMGVQDFSDLIYNTFATEKNQLKVSFVDGDNERNAFVKQLAKDHGKDIAAILRAQKWDERHIFSLLTAMKYYGNTDARKIVITELKFNERILKDLEAAGLSSKSYRVGAKIPERLVARLAADDQLELIAARTESGQLEKGESFFEVHHKVAISEGGRMSVLPAANYRDNYLLLAECLHRNVMHRYDSLFVDKKKAAYRCRLEFEDPNVAFMSGFSKKYQLDVDWTRDPEYQKRAEEDRRYIVSYDDMMDILAENRAAYTSRGARRSIEQTVAEVRRKYQTEPSDRLLKTKKKGLEL
jgi:hypothetical protein